MKDLEIRQVLHSYLCKTNEKFKDSIIVDELNLCNGLARIDVAVINGILHGFEIKSEEDNLTRLPNQVKYYNKSLEKITVAINPFHLESILNFIPYWWGILIIDENINEFRPAAYNPIIESNSLLQLLWKEELLYLLDKYKIEFKKNLNRKIMGEIIAGKLNVDNISQEVRELLKSRKNWRN
jgi:hypothetical protein